MNLKYYTNNFNELKSIVIIEKFLNFRPIINCQKDFEFV